MTCAIVGIAFSGGVDTTYFKEDLSWVPYALGLGGLFISSFGLNYTLSKKLQIFGQPIFRYHLSSTAERQEGINEQILDEHLFTIGLEAGIRKNF